MYRVFPNPAVSFASVVYELRSSAPVSVTIFNARGQRVRTLARGTQSPGRRLLQWDARNEVGVRVP
ncbi:MAG: T9SS type A sorting domain-containing protein, partial [Gammaproteobacteria bacterium]|nr:T9SS type A sorting domain-containing protein [Gammaproteobacteria bacterium]